MKNLKEKLEKIENSIIELNKRITEIEQLLKSNKIQKHVIKENEE